MTPVLVGQRRDRSGGLQRLRPEDIARQAESLQPLLDLVEGIQAQDGGMGFSSFVNLISLEYRGRAIEADSTAWGQCCAAIVKRYVDYVLRECAQEQRRALAFFMASPRGHVVREWLTDGGGGARLLVVRISTLRNIQVAVDPRSSVGAVTLWDSEPPLLECELDLSEVCCRLNAKLRDMAVVGEALNDRVLHLRLRDMRDRYESRLSELLAELNEDVVRQVVEKLKAMLLDTTLVGAAGADVGAINIGATESRGGWWGRSVDAEKAYFAFLLGNRKVGRRFTMDSNHARVADADCTAFMQEGDDRIYVDERIEPRARYFCRDAEIRRVPPLSAREGLVEACAEQGDLNTEPLSELIGKGEKHVRRFEGDFSEALSEHRWLLALKYTGLLGVCPSHSELLRARRGLSPGVWEGADAPVFPAVGELVFRPPASLRLPLHMFSLAYRRNLSRDVAAMVEEAPHLSCYVEVEREVGEPLYRPKFAEFMEDLAFIFNTRSVSPVGAIASVQRYIDSAKEVLAEIEEANRGDSLSFGERWYVTRLEYDGLPEADAIFCSGVRSAADLLGLEEAELADMALKSNDAAQVWQGVRRYQEKIRAGDAIFSAY
ncbi:hypothetical protein HCU74_18615 [Spongiibacter sp. KMU-166]|uniref:Uncharacterized protein n=1 Tax=Spongiibacter thalassae TaxID=2721624 RepID=A0ABX1GJK9_9GAMM|nr:hypothetical protein [Spongiibacter thalassae]NKI19424.1 hypothetical protein [Spongiibacter thalassae]